MRTLSTALIATGVLLMLLSPLWNRVASSSLFWDEKAVQSYSDSVAQMHLANTEAAINSAHAKSAQQAQERFLQNQTKLNRARQFRERGGPIMRLIGGILALIGIASHFITRPADP